jgi:hypothetical protein
MEENELKDPWSMSLLDFIRLAKEFNAALVQMQLSSNDQPVVCLITVRGREECAEILEAIQAIERRWEEQRNNEAEADLAERRAEK